MSCLVQFGGNECYSGQLQGGDHWKDRFHGVMAIKVITRERVLSMDNIYDLGSREVRPTCFRIAATRAVVLGDEPVTHKKRHRQMVTNTLGIVVTIVWMNCTL